MPWFKVDDKLHDHRKTRAAGTEAMGLWVLAGAWCADNLTDGFVPASVLPRWGRTATRMATDLVTAGFWSAAEKEGEPGWLFHEWEQYQPTRERVEKERTEARTRMAVRRKSGRSSGEPPAKFAACSATPTRPDPTRPATVTSPNGFDHSPREAQDRIKLHLLGSGTIGEQDPVFSDGTYDENGNLIVEAT